LSIAIRTARVLIGDYQTRCGSYLAGLLDTTLAGKWPTGDAAQRWEVLNALFERIHVRQDRKVEGYTPRMDRANRVRLLINTAFDYVYGWSEREAEGPGPLTNRLRRGAGGI
jgi:hypothetical protein